MVQNLKAAIHILVLSICACVNTFFYHMAPRIGLAPYLGRLNCLLSILIAIICPIWNLLALNHLINKRVFINQTLFAHKGASFLLGWPINKFLLFCHRVHQFYLVPSFACVDHAHVDNFLFVNWFFLKRDRVLIYLDFPLIIPFY